MKLIPLVPATLIVTSGKIGGTNVMPNELIVAGPLIPLIEMPDITVAPVNAIIVCVAVELNEYPGPAPMPLPVTMRPLTSFGAPLVQPLAKIAGKPDAPMEPFQNHLVSDRLD